METIVVSDSRHVDFKLWCSLCLNPSDPGIQNIKIKIHDLIPEIKD